MGKFLFENSKDVLPAIPAKKEFEFVGFNKHRLNQDDEDEYYTMEIALVEVMNEKIRENYDILERICGQTNLSEREIKIGLSVAQWFGSNVGQSVYLAAENKVKTKREKVKKNEW